MQDPKQQIEGYTTLQIDFLTLKILSLLQKVKTHFPLKCRQIALYFALQADCKTHRVIEKMRMMIIVT